MFVVKRHCLYKRTSQHKQGAKRGTICLYVIGSEDKEFKTNIPVRTNITRFVKKNYECTLFLAASSFAL